MPGFADIFIVFGKFAIFAVALRLLFRDLQFLTGIGIGAFNALEFDGLGLAVGRLLLGVRHIALIVYPFIELGMDWIVNRQRQQEQHVSDNS